MAEAVFRFKTDIEQTRKQIRAGLQGIEQDLAATKGAGASGMFAGFAKAVEDPIVKARNALRVVGESNYQKISRGVQSGGGKQIQDAYRQIEKQAIADAQASAREAGIAAGMNKGEIREALKQVRQAVKDNLNQLRDEINSLLGKELGLSAAQFRKGIERGRSNPRTRAVEDQNDRAKGEKPRSRNLREARGKYAAGPKADEDTSLGRTLANDRQAQRIRGKIVETSLTQRAGAGDEEAQQRLAGIRTEAYAAHRSISEHNRDLKAIADLQNSSENLRARRAKVERDREARLLKFEENLARADAQRQTAKNLAANPRTRDLGAGRKELDGDVYAPRQGGAGYSRVTDQRGAAVLRSDSDKAYDREMTAVEKSIERNRKKKEQQDRVVRTRDERKAYAEQRERDQREAFDRVMADPTSRKISGNRVVQGSTGEVYNARGVGLEREANPVKEAKAHADNVRSIEAAITAREKEIRQGSLFQQFKAGLTSGGINGEAGGAAGIAKSFGTTAKYSLQFAALQALQTAFADTIVQAVDYRDSLTDINVALSDNEQATAGFVDNLSEISKVAGGNVGQALDSAARGVRSFGDGAGGEVDDQRAGEQTARAASNLALIANKAIPDATGDIVAIGNAFGVGADELDRIVDAIAAAKQQGGDPKEIAQGLANGGVALEAAGFTYVEAAQVLSRVVLKLDQSGQATATRISRITQTLNTAQGRELARNLGVDPNASQRDQLVEISNGLADGRYNEAQQSQIKSVLGGTSQLRELEVMLKAIGVELRGGMTEGFDTAGKGADEAARKMGDLAGQLKILLGTVKNIQNEIFDSGVFAPFLAALATLQPLLSTIEDLLKGFNALTDIPGFDFDIAGVGIKDALIGYGEILLARKAYRALSIQNTAAATTESAAELALARSHLSAAAATDVEAASARIAAGLHGANTVAINAETAALTANTAAKGLNSSGFAVAPWYQGPVNGMPLPDADLPEKSRTQRAKGRVAGMASNVWNKSTEIRGRDVPIGKIGVIGAAIVGVVQTWEAATGAADRTTESLKKQTEAQKALASATSAGAVSDELRAAAEERKAASSGFWGNIQSGASTAFNAVGGAVMPFASRADFGANPENDARNLLAAARVEDERKRVIEEERAERAGRSGNNRFGDVFIDPNADTPTIGVDSLKAGIEQLDNAGVSATRQVRMLSQALSGVGGDPGPGTVAPGAGRRIGEQVAGKFIGDMTTSMTDYIMGKGDGDVEVDNAARKAAKDRLEAAKEERTEYRRANPEQDKEDAGYREQDKKVKEAQEDLDEASKARRKARDQAETYLNKFNDTTADPKKAAKLRTKVSDTVKEYIDEAAPNGGVLTEDQLNELAGDLAKLYVSEDTSGKGLKESRRIMQVQLLKRLKGLTDPSKLVVDQTSADFIQDFYVQKSSGVEGETVLTTGDSVQGIRDRISTIREGINASLRAGKEVSDTARLALLQGEKDLAKGLLDRQASYDALAAAQLGADDEVGRAAIAAGTAARNLADALKTPGNVEAINQARIDDIAAKRTEKEARLNRSAAFRTSVVQPGDAVGATKAALANTRERKASTDQFDADGEQNGAYSDVVAQEAADLKASLDAQISQMDANRRAGLKAGDAVGDANAAFADSATKLATLEAYGLRYEADGITETEEYVRLARQKADDIAAGIEAQVAQMNALALSRVKAGDALGQAQARANASALLLVNTTQFGADGLQTEQYSNRETQKNADAYAAAREADATLNARDDRKVGNRDVIANLRNDVIAAHRDVVTAKQFGGQKEIDEALEREEDAINRFRQGFLDRAAAIRVGRRKSGDALGKLNDASRAASDALNLAKTQTKDETVLAPLRAAENDAKRAEQDAIFETALAKRHNKIDPRDSVALARDLRVAADERVKRMKALGDTGPAVEAAIADAAQKAIAEAEAQLKANSDKRRTTIDLTNPMAVATEARQSAEERARKNARPDGTWRDEDIVAVREARNNEEATKFQQNLRQVQTNERLGRITHAAYIDYLNNEKARLEAIANRTYEQQQQLDQVDEALKAARESMQGQFNLGDIKVPTPFEVRRSLASEGAAPSVANAKAEAGAVSSQVQNVDVTINGADLVAVKELIVQLLGPQATGRTPTQLGKKV